MSSLLRTSVSPEANSTRLSRIYMTSVGLLATSRVSSGEARSSVLMTTTAGVPWRVITTRSCSRSTWSTISDRRFVTSRKAVTSRS